MSDDHERFEAGDRTFRRTVTCAWCGNKYHSACPEEFDKGTQGSHCASNVAREGDQWVIYSGYGSSHDFQRHVFVANPPIEPADPVCDECISERWSAGDLADGTTEDYRCARIEDFAPRPPYAWSLIHQIQRLVEKRVAMRKLIDVVLNASTFDGALDNAIDEFRKELRWTGELDDDGPTYAEGCPEVAENMRQAARQLERLAALWEGGKDKRGQS